MYRFIRFFNQNKRTIIEIILIIVFILVVIQLINLYVKNKNKSIKNEITSDILNASDSLISEESLITGRKVSEKELTKSKDLIEKFINNCIDGNIQDAYDMITDKCKEEMFPNIEEFKNIYYSSIFDGNKKNYTIENWEGNIYRVRITNDVLSTGNLDDGSVNQDYITIVSDKLNINSYIGSKEINKSTTNSNIDIDIINKEIYMDYEVYTISVTNNSNNLIVLDNGNNPKSIYLLDEKDMKYYFYNNEVVSSNFIMPGKYKRTFKIKFSNSYNSSRKIKSIVFSDVVLNYNESKENESQETKDINKLYAYM